MVGLLAGIDFSPNPSEFQALLDSGDLVEGLQYVTIELTRQEAGDEKYLTSMFQGAAVQQNWLQGVHAKLTIKKAKVNGKPVVIVYPSAASPTASEADKEAPAKKPPADSTQKTKETPGQDESVDEAERFQCPNCGGTKFSHKPKLIYRKSGKPVSRFIDLFGGGFMTILGIGLLWLTLSTWKTSPSPYLLVTGFLLLGGLPQLIKYLRSEKTREFHYRCIDCRHRWQLSEAEQAQVDAARAIRSTAAGRRPVEETEKPLRRKWLWLAVFAGLILILVCGAIVGALPAILGVGSAPSEQKEVLIASPTTANEIAARPTNTSTATVSAPTEQPPTNTSMPTTTPRLTNTPIPTNTPQPSNTPRPTKTPASTSIPNTPSPLVREPVEIQVIPIGFMVNSVAISPDGQNLVLGVNDNIAQVWDLDEGFMHNLTGHTSEVLSVAFSPDGVTVATGGDDDTVRLWDSTTGEMLKTLVGHDLWVNSVAFSPDGKLLASGSADRTVRLWDTATGQAHDTLEGPNDWIESVAFSPDGSLVAAATCEVVNAEKSFLCDIGEIWLWDVDTGQLQQRLSGHTGWVITVSFSPDGHLLASGSVDETIIIWDLATGQVANTLVGHTLLVNSLAFSPAGTFLASGGDDGKVILWNVETGQAILVLKEHKDWVSVNSVTFSQDGAILISGSEDETAIVWYFAPGP